jgi:uncharacterized protein DUF998
MLLSVGPSWGGLGIRLRMLLGCGAVGGPLFVAALVVEGATRPGYDPIRYPVSLLAVGGFGWEQITKFIATGLLMLASPSRCGWRPGPWAARSGVAAYPREIRGHPAEAAQYPPRPGLVVLAALVRHRWD